MHFHRLEEHGVLDSLYVRALNATDRLLRRILDVLPALAEVPGIGLPYIINKTMGDLRSTARNELTISRNSSTIE